VYCYIVSQNEHNYEKYYVDAGHWLNKIKIKIGVLK